MYVRLCIYVLSFLLCAKVIITEAQETTSGKTTAPASLQQQDFSKVFAMLFQMGLPRLAGAQPASINIYESLAPTDKYNIDIGDMRDIGWIRVSTKDNEPAVCIIGGVFECKLYDSELKIAQPEEKENNSKQSKEQMNNMILPERERFAGKWKISTSARIAEGIKNLLQSKENEYYFRDDKSKYGLLLLQAAQLYDYGAKTEANEIAALLFNAGGSDQVLKAALNVLAEAKYLHAYCGLVESKDWGRFNADLEWIVDNFKDNCEVVRYVKPIQTAAAARARNQEPPELLTASSLSPEERDLVFQLSKITQADYNNYSSVRLMNNCWLFPYDINREGMDGKIEKMPEVFKKIKKGGIKSIPVLIAMLDDDWFLSFRNKSGYIRPMPWGQVRYGNQPILEPSQNVSLSEVADYLILPMTRGELARQLLRPLIIPEQKGQDYAIYEKKGKEFKSLCMAWYETIKNLNGKELQVRYLKDGSSYQRALIIAYMLTRIDDNTVPVIEKALLEYDCGSSEFLDLLLRYCEIRKDKANPFIEKLRTEFYKRLDKEFDSQDQESIHSKEKKKQDIDKLVEEFKQAASVPRLEDVVTKITTSNISGMEEFMFIHMNFLKAAQSQPSEKICKICFGGALQAKHPDQKISILCLLRDMRLGNRKSKLDITKFKDQLEKLLADHSKPSERLYRGPSVAFATAEMIESLVEKGQANNNDEGSGINLYDYREKYEQYLIRRARAILGGVSEDKLPKLTNAKELNESQLNEAKKRISETSEHDLKEFCRQAQLEELIPINAVLQQDKQLNDKLLPLSNQITEVSTDIPELKDQITKFKNNALNEQVLQDILKLAESYVQNGQMLKVTLYRRPELQGVVLKFKRLERQEDDLHFDTSSAKLKIYFSCGSLFRNMSKVVTLKKKNQALTANDFSGSASTQEQEKEFMEDFREAFLKNSNAFATGKIIISENGDFELE